MIYWTLDALSLPIHIREACVFLAPTFSAINAMVMYNLGREIHSKGAGLFAAAFVGIVPSYISRSVAGSYDYEGVAIFAMNLTFLLWIKAVKTGNHEQMKYSFNFCFLFVPEFICHALRIYIFAHTLFV